jgi:hypothetical protein
MNHIVINGAAAVLAVTLPAIFSMVARRMLKLAETRLQLQVSAQTEAELGVAIDTASGLLRAKLATGQMTLGDLRTGNPHVDAAVTTVLNVADKAVAVSGITKQEVADRVLGAVGHALGEDPTVPSIAVIPPVGQTAGAV